MYSSCRSHHAPLAPRASVNVPGRAGTGAGRTSGTAPGRHYFHHDPGTRHGDVFVRFCLFLVFFRSEFWSLEFWRAAARTCVHVCAVRVPWVRDRLLSYMAPPDPAPENTITPNLTAAPQDLYIAHPKYVPLTAYSTT